MVDVDGIGEVLAAREGSAFSPASSLIDERLGELRDWRGPLLAKIRSIVLAADERVEEGWKWRGVPVWSCNGIICTGETYKFIVKMTFPEGASLDDPSSLFNASLQGGVRRAIDFHEGDEVNEDALSALIRRAIALNDEKAARRRS